jgi:hypothetical protein
MRTRVAVVEHLARVIFTEGETLIIHRQVLHSRAELHQRRVADVFR